MRDQLTPMDILKIELNERLNHRERLVALLAKHEETARVFREEMSKLDQEVVGIQDALATLAGPQPLSP